MRKSIRLVAAPGWGSYLLALVASFVCTTGYPQNLVPNASFEVLTACPGHANECNVNLATPWQKAIDGFGTSSVCHSCAPEQYCSVPDGTGDINTPFYQYPHSGNGYAGIFFFNGGGHNNRQYLCVPLISQLTIGKYYYVEYYANLVNYSPYGCNNIAAHFSNNLLVASGLEGLVEVSTDILGYGNPIVLDTLNWIKLGGVYLSSGGGEWLSIGNFRDDNHTDTASKLGMGVQGYGAAYNFDDITVISLENYTLPADAGPDTTIIQGDSTFIGTYINGLTCTWYNAAGQVINTVAPGFYVAPTTSTWYALKQEVAGQTAYDTVNVFVIPLGIHAAQLDEVKLWPNPTAGTLHVSLPAGAKGSYRLTVRAIDGRLVAAASPAAGVREVQLELAAAGVYFATVEEITSGQKVVRKIVVER